MFTTQQNSYTYQTTRSESHTTQAYPLRLIEQLGVNSTPLRLMLRLINKPISHYGYHN